MVFVSICFCFLFFCYAITPQECIFRYNNKIMSLEYNCFLTTPLKLLVFIDLVINIHREFVHSLVNST